MGGSCRSLRCHLFRPLTVLVLAVGLSACGSDGQDGAQGPAGPQGSLGPPGITTLGTAESAGIEVGASITGVSMASPLTIDFTVQTVVGNPVVGLRASEVSFVIAKLVPADGATPFNHWASYIVQVENPTPGVGTGTTCRYQATTENGSAGHFTDHGDGSYTYVTAIDITNVTPPACADDTVDVVYRPSLRHRISLEIRGPELAILNPICDFVPNELTSDPTNNCNNPGQLAAKASREIVGNQSCNDCHGALGLHGGPRINTAECVVCHNPGSTDANSGNTVDFKVMIHKIHRGSQLPSVQAGGSYQIWGHNDSLHDYSDLIFPHPDSDRAAHFPTCTACHDESDPGTPQAANYRLVPSVEACGSCHDDVSFATGAGHDAGPATNAQCAGCHVTGGGTLPNIQVVDAHRDRLQEASDDIVFDLQSVDFSGGLGSAPTVSFQILDQDGNPRNVRTDPDLLASNLSFVVAFPTADYFNYDLGSRAPAQPERTSIYDTGAPVAELVGADPGPYQLPLTVIPDFAATDPIIIDGSGTIGLQGHPEVQITDPLTTMTTAFEARVASASIDFPLDGSNGTPEPRRQKVTVENCRSCHRNLTAHGSNRNDSVEICLTCHNPNATDIGQRPTLDDPNAPTADGKIEESINFAWLIHNLHQEQGVWYGLGGSAFEAAKEVRYPNVKGNCLACHTSDGFYPVSGFNPDVLGTTILTGSTLGDGTAGSGVIDDNPLDDVKITPYAAACVSCHVGESGPTDEVKLHIEQNGGSLNACQLADGTMVENLTAVDPTDTDWTDGCDPSGVSLLEICSVCHSGGRVFDVAKVHPLIE
jgi:OmcA/MtrC family decaheme c-type cytochrome